MAPSIDVVVPVHNQRGLTIACLERLAAQTIAHHVIVVDDGSSDGTAALLDRDWPRVRTIRLACNHGYTRAVNIGVKAGSGEYVVLLNNDVQLHAHCLERLVAPLEADTEVGAVAALMLAPGERTIDSLGITVDVTLAGFARLHGRPVEDATRGELMLAGPEGAAGAFRRRAWEQAQGLDEHIRAYMEIVDLALRLGTLGWRPASAPDAVGVHLGSGTYGRRSPAQRRLAGISRGYLLRRYGVMRSRAAPRALVTEALVIAADALLCRDLNSLRGRAEGWRTAGSHERRAWPREAIDPSISLRESFALRRAAIRPVAS